MYYVSAFAKRLFHCIIRWLQKLDHIPYFFIFKCSVYIWCMPSCDTIIRPRNNTTRNVFEFYVVIWRILFIDIPHIAKSVGFQNVRVKTTSCHFKTNN